jgi:hypothetical protein
MMFLLDILIKCEKEFKSDGVMHTGQAPFRILVKITEQTDPANLGSQFYGYKAASHN